MDHMLAIGGMLNRNLVRSTCDALMDMMIRCEAQAIIDFWNPMACIAARALRKPLITVIQSDVHPHSRGFIWWKDPPPNLPSPVTAINDVLRGYGLPPINSTGELYIGDLTLVLGIPETDPLPESADATYIGPILWQKPGEELPLWAEQLSPEKPLIWVYSGNPRYMPGLRTPVDSAVILDACVEALADEDVQVVLTTGHHALPKNVLPLPANFRYAAYVPGLAMAERSNLLIHHGGYGSCQTGLYTGTPAVIIPTYSERESNARRVAAVGAGVFIVPTEGKSGAKVVRAQDLRAKVSEVLSDPSYALNAARISEKMRAYRGASGVVDLIEGWAQNSR
jgi:UDP:flavonoid glycosyltransferase YjiC (YdhE family)